MNAAYEMGCDVLGADISTLASAYTGGATQPQQGSTGTMASSAGAAAGANPYMAIANMVVDTASSQVSEGQQKGAAKESQWKTEDLQRQAARKTQLDAQLAERLAKQQPSEANQAKLASAKSRLAAIQNKSAQYAAEKAARKALQQASTAASGFYDSAKSFASGVTKSPAKIAAIVAGVSVVGYLIYRRMK